MDENPIARLRKSLNLTQQQFANLAGLSMSSVQGFEGGRAPSAATTAMLVNLALKHGLPEIALALDLLGALGGRIGGAWWYPYVAACPIAQERRCARCPYAIPPGSSAIH